MVCKNCCYAFNPPNGGFNPDPNLGLPLIMMVFVDTAIFSTAGEYGNCSYVNGCRGLTGLELWERDIEMFRGFQAEQGPVHILLYQTMKYAYNTGWEYLTAPGIDIGTVPEILKFTTQFSSEVTADQPITGGQILKNDFETYVKNKYPCILTNVLVYRADQVPRVVNSYSYDPKGAINDFNDYLATPVGGKYPYEYCRPTSYWSDWRPPARPGDPERSCHLQECLSCVKVAGIHANPSSSGQWLAWVSHQMTHDASTAFHNCRFPAE